MQMLPTTKRVAKIRAMIPLNLTPRPTTMHLQLI